MNNSIKYLVFVLVMFLAGSAFGVPKSAVDEFANKLRSKPVGASQVVVKPYAALYKKGDRTEPVTVFFLFGHKHEIENSDGWRYNFAYISDIQDDLAVHHVKYTAVFSWKKIEGNAYGNGEFGILTPVEGYKTVGISLKLPTAQRLEDVCFMSVPAYIQSGATPNIPVTDRFDAVCLEGPCPWIKSEPKVEEPPKPETPKVENPKIEAPPIVLVRTTTPMREPVVLDPVRSVNEKNLTLYERSKKLRNIFRKLPNEPITNWYEWVQANLVLESNPY